MISGVLCDPVGGLHYGANVLIENGIIVNIERNDECSGPLILPGFVDSHVHIESSMLSPVEFGFAKVFNFSCRYNIPKIEQGLCKPLP